MPCDYTFEYFLLNFPYVCLYRFLLYCILYDFVRRAESIYIPYYTVLNVILVFKQWSRQLHFPKAFHSSLWWGLPWWRNGLRYCQWLLAVSHHCPGSNPGCGMWEGYQWLMIERCCSRFTLVPSTTVPACDSCTKCVGNPGIMHDRTQDCHPVSWAWMHRWLHNWPYLGNWCAQRIFDMVSMDICTTRQRQTSGQLVQELNVCTVLTIG